LDDRYTGVLVMLGSLLGVACYFYLLFISPWALHVLQISAFLAVAAVLAIMTWIGYTLATTLYPEPLEPFLEESSKDENLETNDNQL